MVLSSRQSHCESSPGSFDESRMAPSGRRPKAKSDNLDCESACTGCQNLHHPSPFIIITQPESWYSFYRPTEGRRLSRPSWLITYQDGLPVHRWLVPILVLTHPGTNRVWRSETMLIEANVLPLSQTANLAMLSTICSAKQESLQMCAERRHCQRHCHCQLQHWTASPTKEGSH